MKYVCICVVNMLLISLQSNVAEVFDNITTSVTDEIQEHLSTCGENWTQNLILAAVSGCCMAACVLVFYALDKVANLQCVDTCVFKINHPAVYILTSCIRIFTREKFVLASSGLVISQAEVIALRKNNNNTVIPIDQQPISQSTLLTNVNGTLV